MVIEASWLSLASGVIMPMLVALVTRHDAAPAVKSILLATLSGLSGAIQALIEADGVVAAVDWNTVAAAAITTFLAAVGAHFGLLKPAGITGSSGVIASGIPGGVGSPQQKVSSAPTVGDEWARLKQAQESSFLGSGPSGL